MASNDVLLNKPSCHNYKNEDDREIMQGTCLAMCSPEESKMRVNEELIHELEVTATGFKFVKRSCDPDFEMPWLLRPFRVLTDTIHYLLLEIPKRKDIKKVTVKFNFMNDRLRAVRQDMIIQKLPPGQCVVLLEPIIRFYAYYDYRLFYEEPRNFDPVQNKKDLRECIKLFLNCCDELDRVNKVDKDDDDIDGAIKKLKLFEYCTCRPELSCDRILVESLNLMCNLDDLDCMNRYLSLPKYVKRAPFMKLTYDICAAILKGHYITALKLAKKLCPLTSAAFNLHIGIIQRRSFQVMSHAYHSSHRTVPVEVVKDWLRYNSYEEVRGACAHYGLPIVREKHAILFDKNCFVDNPKPQPQNPLRAYVLHLELEEVLSYTIFYSAIKPGPRDYLIPENKVKKRK